MISQTTEYALRAAAYLASTNGSSVSGETIAKATLVPPGYLSKVMRDLVRAGFVVSQRGPNGGFALARRANAITVLDVVNAVTPIQRIRRCPLGKPEHTTLCPLHRRLDAAIAAVEEAFGATTLADLGTEAVATSARGRCTALRAPPAAASAIVPLRTSGRRKPAGPSS